VGLNPPRSRRILFRLVIRAREGGVVVGVKPSNKPSARNAREGLLGRKSLRVAFRAREGGCGGRETL
jgi:hypothetical protein